MTARSSKRPGRRAILRGIGGACLALPFLEYFAPKAAQAATAPKRYAFLFGGMSIGSHAGGLMAPAAAGLLPQTLTPGLAPLGELGVADVVSIVSGLEMPAGVTPPAGGRSTTFHSTTHQVLVSGQRYDQNGFGIISAPSSDWVAAQAIGGGTLQPALVYRAQPLKYRVGSPNESNGEGTISARINGSGQLEQVPPMTSPRLAYEALFSGFVPPDPAQAEAATKELAMRRSIVDLVADDAGALVPRLGTADKLRMQRHFDELRALETRLDPSGLPATSACSVLPDPGNDPPLGDLIDPSSGGDYNALFESSNGYSGEEQRASLMVDLIHMAFACDISRVASLMLTYANCFMNMFPILNLPSDLHEVSHGSIGGSQADTQAALATCAAWHVKHFARLVQKLRDTEDIDGSSVLDNTAVVLGFEGGWGFDPQGGGGDSPHSTENMIILVGGKAGGLNASGGRHIVAPGVHPTAVLNTALSAVGVPTTLGEVSAKVDALIG
ncbi:MAG: DUF1552 domain-containing protein [Polyangiaceae bacterium]|nr:DUF1552 domain-containing protein [Polyangiaceae bacterium]